MTDMRGRPFSRTALNIIYNASGSIANVCISLLIIPLYFKSVGPERYGVLSLIWLFVGYLGFFDLGLSRASANALAREGRISKEERAKIITTVLCINIAIGILCSFLIASLGEFLLRMFFQPPQELEPEISAAIPWIAFLFPFSLVGGIGLGILEADDRFLEANLFQIGGTAAGLAIPACCATFISPELAVVLPATVSVRVTLVVLQLTWALRYGGRLSFKCFDRNRARGLLRYGGWVSVSNIISPLLTSADQIFVGSSVGLSAVAYYAVVMNLVVRSQIFPAALARTLFPLMSRVSAADAGLIAKHTVILIAYCYGVVCAGGIIIAFPALSFWMGIDFAENAAPIAEILLIGAWINSLAMVPFALLQGQGRPDLVAKFHAFELLPFIVILYGMTSQFGLAGAAIAWSLRCTIDTILLFYASQTFDQIGAPIFSSAMLIAVAFSLSFQNAGNAEIGGHISRLALFSFALALWAFVAVALSKKHVRNWRILKELC
jgi:O-antigen/teichoic acid export membrane protein